jgi:hypothetical protein
VFREFSLSRIGIAAGILTIAVGFAYHAAGRPMDFRVYHYGARGVFDGTRPVYGLTSGLGWPMHYRYPPLFLLLFVPFAWLPLGLSAGLWVVLKVAVLVWLLREIVERGLKPATTNVDKQPGMHVAAGFNPRSFLIPLLFITPYLIEEFRYGNAQFFIVALTAVALLRARERPIFAAGSLALAISIKVWPLFFVPYLAVRRDWKVVGYTMGFVILLAILPSVYFGFSGNLHLLAQWFAQESHTQLGESEIWFPNQSLRGVMMRYLTVIDYSQVPDSNYAQVNFASLDPAAVRQAWMLLAGTAYAVFLFITYRRRNGDGWFDHALAFCLLAALEPFTQKYALVVLLWPAVAAAGLMKRPRLRILIYGATALALIQPLAPGSSTQRLLQVLGLDFAATALLTAAIAFACAVMLNPALYNQRSSRNDSLTIR